MMGQYEGFSICEPSWLTRLLNWIAPVIDQATYMPVGFCRVISYEDNICRLGFSIPLPLRWRQHSWYMRAEKWGNLWVFYYRGRFNLGWREDH